MIVEKLATLKYELQHDRALTPIEDDGDPDLALYNEELKARGPTTWHNVEWLYGECYLYRRIGALFKCTQRWKDYDVFAQQKQSAFKSSIVAVVELAAKYRDIIQTSRERASEHTEDDREAEERERLLFIEMCEICLWGNATDLSLLRDLSYDDIQKLQGSKAREESEKNILVSDLDDAFQRLRAAKTSNSSSQVTFVLDNAGFELLVDMILAGFLLDRRLATKVVFQSKSMPWFVSDVVPKDFADLLNALAEPEAFFASGDGYTNSETSKTVLTENQLVDLKFMFENFATLHGEGKLILKSDRFWTQPGSFWRMPHTAPELFHDLQQCQLVVFKGDLNYRKLTGDAQWPPTTPFPSSLGPLGKESGINTLVLRTCKADVVVGLPTGRDEELRRMEGGGGDSGARKWAWQGQWAVVQMCEGRH